MKNTANGGFDYEHIEQLLPWYVTGKLDASERLEVENALEQAPGLRKQLEIIQSEIRETVSSNRAMPMPRADATQRFMASLQNSAPKRQAAGNTGLNGLLEWLTLHLASPPRWAIATGILAIILQAGVIGTLVNEKQAGRYQTASGGTTQQAAGTLVLARFADSASLAALSERLAKHGVTIVDGPKAGGMFTLRIGPENMATAERNQKIAALRAEVDIVVFIGPVQ
jgi:anti-sigma factor RsiW